VVRLVLFVVLAIFVARAFWRIVDGIIEGLSGQPRRSGVVSRGVQMVRDPVCGTYVVPDGALAITHGRHQVFFCSAICRDKFRAQAG
jgi:YHS domain-containing protein